MTIGREHCAAATGVCNDRSIRVECRDVSSGKFTSALEIACVRMQSAAAYLFAWRVDVEVVGAQHALRCAIDSGEKSFTDAARKQQNVAGRTICPGSLCV